MPKIRLNVASGFIDGDRDIRAGVKALRAACPIMRRVHDVTGDPPLRRQPGGFEGLARIIVAQQLSTASAAAIWARVAATVEPMTAVAIAAESDHRLRSAGLSRPKVQTLRALAGAVCDGLDLDRLASLDDAAVHSALCAVKGIGPWTADVYILFSIGRSDGFAPGDLALQVAVQHAAGLEGRPTPDGLRELAEAWRPWRGVAARLLWAYYPHTRGRTSGDRMKAGQPI